MTRKKKFDKKYWFGIFLSILLFVVGFFAGKSYVINGDFANLQNRYDLLNSTYQKNCILNSPNSIQSINQQGGIIAKDIAIESPKREIDEQFIKELKQYLPESKDEKIIITSILGDSEAFQLAKSLKHYLESQGWIVEGVNQAVYTEPVIGIQVKFKPLEFIVGSKL